MIHPIFRIFLAFFIWGIGTGCSSGIYLKEEVTKNLLQLSKQQFLVYLRVYEFKVGNRKNVSSRQMLKEYDLVKRMANHYYAILNQQANSIRKNPSSGYASLDASLHGNTKKQLKLFIVKYPSPLNSFEEQKITSRYAKKNYHYFQKFLAMWNQIKPAKRKKLLPALSGYFQSFYWEDFGRVQGTKVLVDREKAYQYLNSLAKQVLKEPANKRSQ